jgi:hypothetical protein
MKKIKSLRDLPLAVSIEEFAEVFRVTAEQVMTDVRSGRLKSVVVGTVIRILTESLKESEQSGVEREMKIDNGSSRLSWNTAAISPAAPFVFRWPTRRGRPTANNENYPEAYMTEAKLADGRVLNVRIGVTERECAGKTDRKRILVTVNDRAMVEFVGDTDFESNGLVAAVIKPDGRHHLRYGQPIPDGYGSFDIRPYNQIVRGPKASSGLAIVCSINDRKTMVDHGILRWQTKEE